MIRHRGVGRSQVKEIRVITFSRVLRKAKKTEKECMKEATKMKNEHSLQ